MKEFGSKLIGLLIATNNTTQMVEFYESVFKIKFESLNFGKHTMYQSQINGIDFTLSSNQLHRIRAEKSRYQLNFVVPNIEDSLLYVNHTGGDQILDVTYGEGEKYCSILDPDGNTIELVEYIPSEEEFYLAG